MPDISSREMELFTELLSVPSPPGREERLAAKIAGIVESVGYPCESDGAGNLTVRLKDGDGGKTLFAAHMDEIGMVVTGIDPDGRLRIDASGGLVPAKIGECPLDIVGDKDILTGVLSMGSTHRPNSEELRFAWQDLRIITGLTPNELTEAGVRVGSSAVPVRDVRGPIRFGGGDDPLVAAWTFDDRMGVACLLRLLEEIKTKGVIPLQPLLVCFTVHEEAGCHGAKVLAHREKPEIFVAVDGCPMVPGSDLVLDGRPGIWSKDKITNYDQRLIGRFSEAARNAGTDLQVAVFQAAASDASKAYEAGAAERVAALGHVRENSHGYEVARLSVFQNVVKTLFGFVEGMAG